MSVSPRRRRPSGSLGASKRYLWAVASYGLELVEDPERPDDVRIKGGNMLVNAITAWVHAHEGTEFEARLRALETSAAHERNGRR